MSTESPAGPDLRSTPETILVRLAADQQGLVSSSDVRRSLISASSWHRLVKTGRWTEVCTGVFRHRTVELTYLVRCRAALMTVGSAGKWRLSHQSAAWLLGLVEEPALESPVHLTGTTRARPRPRPATVFHRASGFARGDRAFAGDLPVTSAARTLIDLSRTVSRRELEDAFDAAVRTRQISVAALVRRIESCHGIPIETLRAVIDGTPRGGVHNRLERTFLDLVRQAGLPDPETQVPGRAQGRRFRVDFWFPSIRLVVEVTGHRHHSSRNDRRLDASRARALVAGRRSVIEFTSDEVFHQPNVVVAELRGVDAALREVGGG